MALKINQKILLMLVVFFLVPLGMFLATVYIVNQQQSDGLVINLAGRQRMLSQKMSKECLTYLHLVMMNLEGQKKVRNTLLNTMDVFDVTLKALIESGRAPLTLDLSGKKREIPAASDDAAVQLNKVKALWSPFRQAVMKAIESKEEKDIQVVLKNNLPLLQEMDRAVQMMQKQAESKVSTLFYAQLVFQILGVLIVVLVLIWSGRAIVKPIRASVDLARIMADGDLTQEIQLQQHDEIGELVNSLNHMIKTLSGMIADINSDVVTLNESSDEMSAVSEQMATVSDSTVEKANTVAAAAEETDASMNSIAAAMEQASTNMDTVASAAEEMSANIVEVSRGIGKANLSTKNAVERAIEASEQVSKLGEAAQEIGVVSETITAISDKTALLALNATIEAARAGDAGKGFAVVANEIKELAQQTAEATGAISGKLLGIQQLTDETVKNIEEISGATAEANQTVDEITESIEQQNVATKEISSNVSQASLGLKEINQNVVQTNAATSQVAQEIFEVNDQAGQLSASSAQVQQTATQLKGLSEHLKNLVERFKIA